MTTILLKFLMLYLGARPLYAASNLTTEGPGARAAVFGRAATSLVQDPSALYWNPAGLAGAGGAVSGEHLFLYDGARYDFLGLTVPSRLGTFGLGAVQLYRGGITARAAIDDPGHSVSASQAEFRGGFARDLGRGFSAGATLNVLDVNLGGYRDRGFGMDAGARFAARGADLGPLGRPRWSAGAVVKNLLAPGLKLDQDPEVLPRELRGGVSVSFDGLSRLSLAAGAVRKDRAMVGLGLSKTVGGTELRMGAGVAYTLQDALTLRLGLEDGFALGVGFKTSDGRFSVDYAMENRPLAMEHRFTVTYRFLRPDRRDAVPAEVVPDGEYARAKARAESLGEEAFARGRKAFSESRYEEAAAGLSLAALLEPGRGDILDLSRRAAEARERETVRGLRRALDERAGAGDAKGAYLAVAGLLRFEPEDRVRLLERARHLAGTMDAATRDEVSAELSAAGRREATTSQERGLDSRALGAASWLEEVAASTPTAAEARDFAATVRRRSAEHRASLMATAGDRAVGREGRALLAAFALRRAYPDDPAVTGLLGRLRAAYEASLSLSDTDTLYVRKLYYLAAAAWSRKDAQEASALLDELRRRDAADADAASLMDAMARAGAVYERFDGNGGGQ